MKYSPLDILLKTLKRARDDRVTFLAAAVAYYAFVSLIPILLLLIAVGSLIGGERIANYLINQVGATLTKSGESLIRDALTRAAGREEATTFGVLVLLWTGIKFFRGLDAAFSQVYGIQEVESLPEQVKDAIIVLGGVGVGVSAVVIV
ncbi:MAG: YhjD/YihY/BrkB family envelope integrity protein, partial [Halobacteriaceae archaeon]